MTFGQYIEMGVEHILDLGGYDHVLFIASLLLVYSLSDWKRIMGLLTAFTIGHALSMLASAFDFFPLSSKWIEFLIPLSILITAVYHLIWGKLSGWWNYLLILAFGLIHGMGYARGFGRMLMGTEKKLTALLGFNLGVEIAQIGFGILLLLLLGILAQIPKVEMRPLRMLIFGVILTLATQLVIANWI